MHDGSVRCPCGDHGDEASRLRHAPCDPDAARECVLLGLGDRLAHGRACSVVGPRREHAPCASFEKRDEDAHDLLGRLPLGENGLRSALAQLAMEIDACESEIAVRAARRAARARRPGSSSRREHPRAARADRRGARPQGDSKVGAWEPRPPRSRGSAARFPASRTRRSSADEADSSTISIRSRTRSTPRCCARRSRTRESPRSTRRPRWSSQASSAS